MINVQNLSSTTYSNFSWTAPTAKAEQNVSLYIVLQDKAGNQNQTTNVTIFVADTTGPVITLSSPVNNTLTNNNSIS